VCHTCHIAREMRLLSRAPRTLHSGAEISSPLAFASAFAERMLSCRCTRKKCFVVDVFDDVARDESARVHAINRRCFGYSARRIWRRASAGSANSDTGTCHVSAAVRRTFTACFEAAFECERASRPEQLQIQMLGERKDCLRVTDLLLI
jgi:hypothetical protein